MLELIYARGLRVSELVTLKNFNVSMGEGVLRVLGKGNKERLVPFGLVARDWITCYIAESRPVILGGQQTLDLFVTARGEGMTREMFWMIVTKHAAQRRHHGTAVAAHVASRVRHPFAHPRRGPARRADAAGTHVARERLKQLHAQHHPRG